jgi:hypothetical protein
LLLEGAIIAEKGLVIGYRDGIEMLQAPRGLATVVSGNTLGATGAPASPFTSYQPTYENAQIFLPVAELDSLGEPEPAIIEGTIKRIGIDLLAPVAQIYTTIPFKLNYRGAPILDSSEHMLGIVCAPDRGGLATALPVRYTPAGVSSPTGDADQVMRSAIYIYAVLIFSVPFLILWRFCFGLPI